jgi:hypothetical protein
MGTLRLKRDVLSFGVVLSCGIDEHFLDAKNEFYYCYLLEVIVDKHWL